MKTKICKKYGANADERETCMPMRFDAELSVDNAVRFADCNKHTSHVQSNDNRQQ